MSFDPLNFKVVRKARVGISSINETPGHAHAEIDAAKNADIGASSKSLTPREKVIGGLRELEQIRTASDARQAKEAGIALSVDGFRKRHKIGSDGMRADPVLFQSLHNELTRIRLLKADVPVGGGNGRPRSRQAPKGGVDGLQELRSQLAARHEDVVRLIRIIEALRAENAHLRRRLAE